jgi:hypothetical protein
MIKRKQVRRNSRKSSWLMIFRTIRLLLEIADATRRWEWW